jgi:LDH2 family malate/lactate/ureidoglycolate dehydrogenase
MSARIPLSDLEAWVSDVLIACGVSAVAAAATAEVLVDANRRGVDTHGVAQLHFYIPALLAGTIDGAAEPMILVDLPAAAVVDGQNGLGAYVSRFAMKVCCDKAATSGAAVVGVRGSTHFGAASCFSEQAARANCVGIVVSNSDPGMSPPGGLGPVLGTNPLAIAAPSDANGRLPSLDIATSVVAHGRIVAAARSKSEIPAGWAIGPDGEDTTDPVAALAGSMLPMGGYKGFGLAFMIDVLCGSVAGSQISPDITNDIENPQIQGTGHLFIAIHVPSLRPIQDYEASLERLSRVVHDAPRLSDSPPYMTPGELEASASRSRTVDGVQLDGPVRQRLSELGETAGVPFPS